MAVARPARRHSILTRSMSRTMPELMKVHVSCCQDLVDICLASLKTEDQKNTACEILHRFDSYKSGRIVKRRWATLLKRSIRKDRYKSSERMQVLQNLFREMHVDESCSSDVCGYCNVMKRFIYDSKKTEAPPGTCKCYGEDEKTLPNITKPLPDITETLILPSQRPDEEFNGASGPYPCYISNSSTGLAWQPRGKFLKAVFGPSSDMRYWTITGTRNGRRGFVFGYQSRRSWVYATVNRGGKIRFQSHDSEPDFIDVEGTVTDSRVFYFTESSRGGYLVSATMIDHYARINPVQMLVEVIGDQRLADSWQIEKA